MKNQLGLILKLLAFFFLPSCTYIKYLRVDPWYVGFRSDVITDPEIEKAILSKARLDWTEDGRIRVLYLKGTAYERGYQHGVLLRKEIQDNLGYLYDNAVSTFHSEELFDEAYERMRPFIPQEYVDEMHGLAHGSKMPLRVIHAIHALPELTEWGGKKKLKEILVKMMDGELATSCSNLSVANTCTEGGKMYTVRILDWGLHKISKLHQYPLLTVHKPDLGNSYVNIGWVGFLGAISGMNDKGITLGEMGYGSPDNETFRGKPMPFLLRDVLGHTSNLKEVRDMISKSPGTNSFVYLMSDGKTKEAELYVRDRDRFLVFEKGQDIKDAEENIKGINDSVYGGHYNEKMTERISNNFGKISPEVLIKDIIPEIAMKSNFQNVVYSPSDLKFWVSYSADKKSRAAEGTYSFFDLGKALRD